ncbi:hypothetical protein B0H63DRAFT_304532 [Podospora didyma]|uniref:Glycosyltransferase Family 25 n=1 Tax=Podospora didyma TaxID=330526 RepID=A0AAE0N3Y2_9PEZI|nr:hypothetical protein B0H63DRAFT_304532 [Podospora didyma]
MSSILRRPLLRARHLVVVVILVFLVCRLWIYPPPLSHSWLSLPGNRKAAVVPTNSTLGFGRIYVISKEDSPRRPGLLQAANVTELDLTIPVQPTWTKVDLEGHDGIGRGSVLAWLGHLHSLRQFVESGVETALFFEDDVDWDIRLRSMQAPLVATAVRTLLAPKPDPTGSLNTDAHPNSRSDPKRYPYGDPAAWDLLYLGHCGDYWHSTGDGFEKGHVKPEDLTARPHISFNDSSVPDPNNLHPWTASLLENLGVPPRTRLVHSSVFPLCTFAYAVTRDAAKHMLKHLSLEARADDVVAYDVAILHQCRSSSGLRCWTINPELFHHMPGKSMISGIDNHSNIPPVDATGREQAEIRHESPNIDCGFWSGAFSFKPNDKRRLNHLRREVGRKGRCLKPGRDLPY